MVNSVKCAYIEKIGNVSLHQTKFIIVAFRNVKIKVNYIVHHASYMVQRISCIVLQTLCIIQYISFILLILTELPYLHNYVQEHKPKL